MTRQDEAAYVPPNHRESDDLLPGKAGDLGGKAGMAPKKKQSIFHESRAEGK